MTTGLVLVSFPSRCKQESNGTVVDHCIAVRTDSVRKVQAWLDNIISDLDITDEEATEASAITEDAKVAAALEHQLNSELDDETVVAADDWEVL